MSGVAGVQGPISQFVINNKSLAEEAIKANIREVTQDPAKTVRELQQPSPLSQFLDIRV